MNINEPMRIENVMEEYGMTYEESQSYLKSTDEDWGALGGTTCNIKQNRVAPKPGVWSPVGICGMSIQPDESR